MASLLSDLNFSLYLTNFLRDPCYVDADFLKTQESMIADICSNISDFKVSYYNASYSVLDIDAQAKAYRACYPSWGSNYPGSTTPLGSSKTWFHNNSFAGKCNITQMTSSISLAADTDVDYIGILVSTGLISQLFLKLFITELIYHGMALIDPMVTNRGKVDVPIADFLEPDEKRKIMRFKRDSHWIPFIVSALLCFLSISNLIATSVGITTSELLRR